MNAVHKLHEDEAQQVAVAPRDAHMQFDLGGGRSIVIRTVIDALAPAEQVDRELAFIADRGDRMRLRYDLKVMRKELALHEKTLASGHADLLLIDQRAKDAWENRLKSMAIEIVKSDEQGRIAWKRSGKQSEYRREGARKSTIDKMETDMLAMKAEGFKPTEKERIDRQNAEVTLGKHAERIEEIKREIEEAEASLKTSG